MSAILRKYGASATILFPLIDAGAVDFESTPVTFASGDTQISKDEGVFANTTNNPAHEGNGIYSLVLTATEMQAARVVVTVIDSATKTWEDQAIIIDTYGNASAQHAVDLDDGVRAGLTALPNAAADDAGGLPISDAGGLDMDAILVDTNSLNDTKVPDTISLANINAQVDTAIADVNLDHLVGTATGIPAVPAGTFLDQIMDDGTATFDRTTDSLQAIADSGGGGPTAAQIADAVWDELQSGHVTAGSFGEIATEIASILVDTAEIGAAGAGLTAIPWNAAWDAEVQSEANDALVALGLDHIVHHSDTAQAGAANSITLATGAEATTDDLYVGQTIFITGGTGAGQSRSVTNYVAATRVATVHRNWDLTPDATSTYIVYSITGADDFLFKIEQDTGTLGVKVSSAGFQNIWEDVQMTEDYAADGNTATPAQMLYMIWSALSQFDITGTTITARKVNGATSSMTFTLDDASNPTSRTRAT